jgi:hypothetical protein
MKCKPQPPPSYFYSLSTFSFFKMRNYLDKVNAKFKSFFSFWPSVWMMKWNQMTHCLDRIGFLKKIWLLFDIVIGGSHIVYSRHSRSTTMRGGKEESFKNSRPFTLVTPFSPLIWFESVRYCEYDSLGKQLHFFAWVTSRHSQLNYVVLFSTFETTHFLQSFFSLLFVLFLSCFFLLFLSVVSRSRPEYNRVLQIRNITR